MNNNLTQKARHPGLFVYHGLKQLGQHLINLIYPPVCAGCGRVDTNWCNPCHTELTAYPCTPEFSTLTSIPEVVSSAEHTGIVRTAIHALKYNHAQHLAGTFADRLVQIMPDTWQVDCLIPVPLHPARLKHRGYNQAEVIARALALKLNRPMHPDALVRIRETASQVTKSQDERHLNVKDAFTGSALLLNNKTVLLIDDVMTTGATLQACADSAILAGARKVYGLTVSRA